jgi:hypothetical protein
MALGSISIGLLARLEADFLILIFDFLIFLIFAILHIKSRSIRAQPKRCPPCCPRQQREGRSCRKTKLRHQPHPYECSAGTSKVYLPLLPFEILTTGIEET